MTSGTGAGNMDVFEAMGSAVTMRWLTEEPVPGELVEKLIWAGTC